MKYLLVDDSNMARKLDKKILRSILGDDIEVEEATNGEEAVNKYKNIKPALTLMDLTMPIMDGYEAIKQIIEYDKDAKVIVVSADVQSGAMQRAKDNGALGFLEKPINKEKLEFMLNKLELI